MKSGDLVIFDKTVVSEILEADSAGWEEWIGMVLRLQDADHCYVIWHDGETRWEFIDYLEVVHECR